MSLALNWAQIFLGTCLVRESRLHGLSQGSEAGATICWTVRSKMMVLDDPPSAPTSGLGMFVVPS